MSYSESDLYRLPKDILIKIICQISTELKEKHDKKCDAIRPFIFKSSTLSECKFCYKWMFTIGDYIVTDKFHWEEYNFEKQHKFLIYECQKCNIEMCYQHSHFPEKPEDVKQHNKDEVLCEKCFNLK